MKDSFFGYDSIPCCAVYAGSWEPHWLVSSILFFAMIFVPLLVIEWWNDTK